MRPIVIPFLVPTEPRMVRQRKLAGLPISLAPTNMRTSLDVLETFRELP